jgi:hypothetical protein
MEAAQRRCFVGYELRTSAIWSPLASTRLTAGDAKLGRVEVGLEGQLEANGGGQGTKSRQLRSEYGEIRLKHRLEWGWVPDIR